MSLFGFNLLAFLLVLTPIVFIHELGHFWAARRSGVTVEVFSVGFGRELIGFTDRHGTRWRFSLIPLGGYVRMAGDTSEAGGAEAGAEHIAGNFAAASLAARAFIVSMGPIANMLLGIMLFAGIYLGLGKVIIPPQIGEVIEGGAAERAGLVRGDLVLEVNGYSIDDFNDLRGHILENPGREISMLVERDGAILSLPVTPDTEHDACMVVDFGKLGVRSAGGEHRQMGPADALVTATADSFSLALTMLRGIGRLVSGNANSGEIGGPVKIAEMSGRAASQGLISLVFFAALISINLALVNLLPIPALDGGHLLLYAVEAVLGRPLGQRLQEILMRGGMALLLSLIVLVTVLDILSVTRSDC